ncbi:MAG: hypothetical protein D4R68_01420 [Ignavibacteriales bacterium]|nr:MAG: hypothetical protein D4R68_01420 [Ignavibacteriales bacterium]
MNGLIKNILMRFCLLTFFALLVSCQKSPEPIAYGSDGCENCKMTISDPKFGAELINTKGKIYKFDSAECLAAFGRTIKPEEINSEWVTNFLMPGEFIKANDAAFLISNKIKSPMGLNISAFSNQKSLDEIRSTSGEKALDWKDVQSYVQNEWK